MVQESTWFAVGSGGVRFGMHAGKVGPACMAVMARQQGHRQAKQGPCSSPHVMVFRYQVVQFASKLLAARASAASQLSLLRGLASWAGCQAVLGGRPVAKPPWRHCRC